MMKEYFELISKKNKLMVEIEQLDGDYTEPGAVRWFAAHDELKQVEIKMMKIAKQATAEQMKEWSNIYRTR